MQVVLQILFDALLLVGIYAIGALGFALIWGVLNLLNLAHGAFIMLGAYTTFLLWRQGLDPLLALPVTMLVMFVFGWLVQRYLFDFLVSAPHAQSIALTFGVNLVLMGLALRVFTAEYRSIVVPAYLQGFIDVGGAKLTYARIATIVIAVGLTAALWWFMERTETGQAIGLNSKGVVYPAQWHDGKVKLVYPPNLATAKPMHPFPLWKKA